LKSCAFRISALKTRCNPAIPVEAKQNPYFLMKCHKCGEEVAAGIDERSETRPCTSLYLKAARVDDPGILMAAYVGTLESGY